MKMQQDRNVHTEADIFALASQLYVRLRRATGRVIDVTYLEQNQEYANAMITLASQAPDTELQQLAQRLRERMFRHSTTVQNEKNVEESQVMSSDTLDANEIFKAEIPHHYIGALR